mgnify:CR=1 FL=1
MSEVYPAVPIPSSVIIEPIWKVNTTAFDSGKEQRHLKTNYPKYDVSLTYDVLNTTNMQILWNFYQARKGSYDTFCFYALESAAWTGGYIGVGDGYTTTFNIPGKSMSGLVVYVNNVSMEDYTINVGVGDGGADQIVFDAAPAANALLTCDFTGLLRIYCRFEGNIKRTSMGGYGLFSASVKLKGVAGL